MNPSSLEIVFRDYYPESVRKFFEKINPFLFPKKKKIVDNLSSDAQKVDEQKQDEPEQNYGIYKLKFCITFFIIRQA